MLQLCGFADEISPDPAEQAAVCRRLGLASVELRSARGVNVLDFDAGLRADVKAAFVDVGMTVACVGSPIGKVKVDEPWDAHFDRFKVAVDAAGYFGATLIRVFSYYPPDGGAIAAHREEVVRRFAAKVAYVDANAPGVTLVHENERHIFGERLAACLDLMRSIDSPRLRSAFDFANFVQAGDDPQVNWPALKPYTTHIHVKDALADGTVVPAGQGVGGVGPILADAYQSGYRGLLSLEPHLAAAGRFGGFSGPDRFAAAVQALRDVCRDAGVPLA